MGPYEKALLIEQWAIQNYGPEVGRQIGLLALSHAFSPGERHFTKPSQYFNRGRTRVKEPHPMVPERFLATEEGFRRIQ